MPDPNSIPVPEAAELGLTDPELLREQPRSIWFVATDDRGRRVIARVELTPNGSISRATVVPMLGARDRRAWTRADYANDVADTEEER